MAAQRGPPFPQPLFQLPSGLGHPKGHPVEFSKFMGAGPNDRSGGCFHQGVLMEIACTFGQLLN